MPAGTVKSGNVVTFFAQSNFFLRILFRWPNVICCYKIQLKKGLDVGMNIFGFCEHLGPFFFFKCWGDDITHTSGNVVTPFYYRCIWRILAPAGKVATLRCFKKYSRDPYEAIDTSNGSLARFFYIQETKQYKTRKSSKNRLRKESFKFFTLDPRWVNNQYPDPDPIWTSWIIFPKA